MRGGLGHEGERVGCMATRVDEDGFGGEVRNKVRRRHMEDVV